MTKEALLSRFAAGVQAMGDPDKDLCELVSGGISAAALLLKMVDLDYQLKNMEAVQDLLIALKEEKEADRVEQIMRKDVRLKVKVALKRIEKECGWNQ